MAKKKITDNSVLGIIYMLVLAAAITLFVGITISTFYPAPEYPNEQITEIKEAPVTSEEKVIEEQNQAIEKEYQADLKNWAEVASIIVIVVATFLVTLGLSLSGKMVVLPNGILLGGLFTIFMGVIFSTMSESRYLIFGVVTAALAIIITAGYLKFVYFEKK